METFQTVLKKAVERTGARPLAVSAHASDDTHRPHARLLTQ